MKMSILRSRWSRLCVLSTMLSAACVADGGDAESDDAPYDEDFELGDVSQATLLDPGAYAIASYCTASYPTCLNGVIPNSSANSTGEPNRIVRTGVGSYRVELQGVGQLGGGNAQVTNRTPSIVSGSGSWATSTTRCKPSSTTLVHVWTGERERWDIHVGVRCHTPAGSLVDVNDGEGLQVSYYHGGSSDIGAYVHADKPTAASYSPTNSNTWTSLPYAGAISIARSGVGAYSVTIPGHAGGAELGNVQVSAFGTDSSHCKVGGWFNATGPNLVASVYCHTTSGARADRAFILSYTNTRVPSYGGRGGYVWAGSPTTPSYTPPTAWSWNSNGSTTLNSGEGLPDPLVIRKRVGEYIVRYYGAMWQPVVPHVTAYGSGSEYCITGARWVTNGTTSEFSVACYNSAGASVDTAFSQRTVFRPLSGKL